MGERSDAVLRTAMSARDTARVAGASEQIHLSNSPAGKRQRSGKSSAPGRRPSCPPRKQSRRVKRRKALVRKPPHPVATLRSGQSLQRKGLPAHDAGRRALRRFTAVISVRPSPTRSGHACPSGSIPSTGGPAGSLLTGRIARKVESRGAPRARLIRPDPQTPLPAPPTESPRMMPSNERGCSTYRTKREHVNPAPGAPKMMGLAELFWSRVTLQTALPINKETDSTRSHRRKLTHGRSGRPLLADSLTVVARASYNAGRCGRLAQRESVPFTRERS
jgi:hypothetical protein